MHILCTLFLGVCIPCAHFFGVHAHFFQTFKKPPFSLSCTGSFRIPVSLIGPITSPTSLDRNSKLLFSVVLKVLKSPQSLHGVHEVSTGLPPYDRPDCAQTLQTSRSCPKPPGSKRQSSQTPVRKRDGAAKMKVAKIPLFDPFWRARRANTIGPIAPKLCRPRDLARHRRIPKSERRASTLASTTLPQKREPGFAAGASFV
jgi:hypothetical protein